MVSRWGNGKSGALHGLGIRTYTHFPTSALLGNFLLIYNNIEKTKAFCFVELSSSVCSSDESRKPWD